MSENFRKLSDTVWVAPQISPADIALAAENDIHLIVNNRPDGEMFGQPKSADIQAAATEAGIAYVHIPVDGRGITPDHLDQLDAAMKRADNQRMLAFCASGTRSTFLISYVAARAGTPIEQIISEAAAAGYNVSGHENALRAIQDEAKSSV